MKVFQEFALQFQILWCAARCRAKISPLAAPRIIFWYIGRFISGILAFHYPSWPTLVSAPTGASESLTFELAPYTFDRLFGEDCNAIVLVIVPLISLMENQVSNLNSRGIRASYLGDDCSEEQLEDILNLKEKIVFGSPEAILNIILIPWSFRTRVRSCRHSDDTKYLLKNRDLLSQYWLEIETSFCFFPAPWARQLSPKIIVRDNFRTK